MIKQTADCRTYWPADQWSLTLARKWVASELQVSAELLAVARLFVCLCVCQRCLCNQAVDQVKANNWWMHWKISPHHWFCCINTLCHYKIFVVCTLLFPCCFGLQLAYSFRFVSMWKLFARVIGSSINALCLLVILLQHILMSSGNYAVIQLQQECGKRIGLI